MTRGTSFIRALCNSWPTRFAWAAALMIGSIHAQAQSVTTYTSRSLFNAASTSQTTITFEGLTPTDLNGPGFASLTVSGVTFTNYESRLYVYNPTPGSPQDVGTG